MEPQPSLVRLIFDHQTMTVMVFDERPPLERHDSLPPEVDKDLGQIMRDELLFEQYGGQIAEGGVNEDTSGVGPDDAEQEADATADGVEKPTTGHADSYAVPAFVAARKHLAVVDNWADQVNREAEHCGGTSELQMLRRDGELLKDAFRRQAARDERLSPPQAIGARLATEEMALRLEHFPED
jgi:hypothetical protein